MAFCENCGKELADGEQCTCTASETVAQAPVTEATPAAAPVGAVPVAKEEKPNNNNKIIIGVIVAVAALVVVLLLVVVLAIGGSKGYMKPVDNFMKAFNKKNTDPVELYTTLMPDFSADLYADTYKKFMVSEDFKDMYDEAIESMEDYYDECEDEYGKCKLSFESKKASKMDKDDLEDVQDYLDDYYDDYIEDQIDELEDMLEDADELEDEADELDISESEMKAIVKSYIKYLKSYEKMKVTAGYEVKGKFIVKAGKDEYKTETVEFQVVKINGDWVYWGISDGSMYFEDDDENCFGFIRNFLSGKMLEPGVF